MIVDSLGSRRLISLDYFLWCNKWFDQDPRGWWGEPRENNMRSKMTPDTLPSTELNLAPGQTSSDRKSWDAVSNYLHPF